MAYATRADIEAIYGRRYLETLLPTDVDGDAAVTRALSDASAIIDSYLSMRYRLPLASTPNVVRGWAIDIACWKVAPADVRLTEEIVNRAKVAIKMLEGIAAGKAQIAELESVGAGLTPGPGEDGAITDGASFTAEERRGWELLR